jgi:peptide methionine sulfoxide reductase msrA/msrB
MLKYIDVLKFANHGNPEPDQVVNKTESEWKAQLPPDIYQVTRLKGTERAYSSEMCSSFEPGLYACVCCGTLLFDGREKFESGTGWPSFTQPVKANAVAYERDTSYGMRRIEALCNTCKSHLGHVFPDGPAPSGLRYCMNALSLEKIKANFEKAVFGGGCFWCTEAIFDELKGVEAVESGYSGGAIANPTYREVCSGRTGHAEVVQVTFNPAEISYEDLLRIHLSTHNPTTLNRQGADVGTQYRSIILVSDEQQRASAEKIVQEMRAMYSEEIVTEIKKLEAFYIAEAEHQEFYVNNPEEGYCQAVVNPKLEKFRKLFSSLRK